MASAVNKKERLLNLAALLLNTERPIAASAVRSRVEGYPDGDSAFHRTFERDKDELRRIGIPLTTEEIPATDPPILGYRILPDDYYLADPGLSADELAALHFATLAVQFGDPDEEALWKLGGVGLSGVPEVSVLTSLPSDNNVVVLFDAILAKQAVEFSYSDKSRSVQPWRLDYQRGRWYLSGYDAGAMAERNYRLDRMQGSVTPTGEAGAFESPVEHETGERRVLRPWEIGDGDPVVAELQVSGHRAEIARQRLGGGDATYDAEIPERHTADGSVIFDVPVINQHAFRSFVLEFLEDAELLSPPSMREDMISWLTRLAEVPS